MPTLTQQQFLALSDSDKWNAFENDQGARDNAIASLATADADKQAALATLTANKDADKQAALAALTASKDADKQAALDALTASKDADKASALAALTASKDAEKAAIQTQLDAANGQIATLTADKQALAIQLVGGVVPTAITVPAVVLVALQIEATAKGITPAEAFAAHAETLIRQIATSQQNTIFTQAMQAFPNRPQADQVAILTLLGLADYVVLPIEALTKVMDALALPAYLALNRADQTAIMQHLGLA